MLDVGNEVPRPPRGLGAGLGSASPIAREPRETQVPVPFVPHPQENVPVQDQVSRTHWELHGVRGHIMGSHTLWPYWPSHHSSVGMETEF